MLKITKKPKTPNIIWDASSNSPICKFVNGTFETNDEALASKLKDLGHTVEGEADVKTFDKMKLDELKAYATEHNIEVGEAASKADILKIIQEVTDRG